MRKTFFLLSVTALLTTFFACQQSNPGIYNVKDYGAKGEKEQLATNNIQDAIDACHQAGGGRVYFPPGEYLTGTIVLKDNVNLHVEAGATIFSSRDTNDFKTDFKVIKKNDSGKEGKGITPVLIYAKGAKNISITGKGEINGQAERTYEPLKKVDGFISDITENARKAGVEMKMYYKVKPYVSMIFLEDCENVTVRDVSLIESCDWTLHFKWSRKILIDNIYIFSSLNAGVNADGIDIDGCQDAVINNCIIHTGDDAIVLKSTETFDKSEPCEHITVSNCDLVSTSSALKLGTESYGDFRNINFSNCVIRNTNRGLSIVVRDGATAENINFSDIILECNRKHFNWWGNGDPIWLVLKKRYPDSKLGVIKNITFENIIAHGQGTSKIEGFPGKQPLQNISLKNVQFFMHPEEYKDKRATHAFEAHDVDDLSLTDVKVYWDEKDPEPKWQNAFTLRDINQMRLDKLSGKQAPTDHGVFIELTNVQDAIVENCYLEKGANVFLKAHNSNAIINNNYLMNVSKKLIKEGNSTIKNK